MVAETNREFCCFDTGILDRLFSQICRDNARVRSSLRWLIHRTFTTAFPKSNFEAIVGAVMNLLAASLSFVINVPAIVGRTTSTPVFLDSVTVRQRELWSPLQWSGAVRNKTARKMGIPARREMSAPHRNWAANIRIVSRGVLWVRSYFLFWIPFF